jgi:AcrR family transcriptional regulator
MARKETQSQKNSTKIRKAILSAALDVASLHPWEFVSMSEIADSAGLKPHHVTSVFPTKSDILCALIDDLDLEVEKSFTNYDETIPARDRIFDVLMERFDLANAHRNAHISFFKSFGWTCHEARYDLGLMKNSMSRMAKCAGLDTKGLAGTMTIAGLAMAYLWVVLTWMHDTSPDLGKTMAELDKTLGRIDMMTSMIKNYATRSPSNS